MSFFPSTFLSLSHTNFFFFSLSQELMITQQTTQFKLCTRDYITTMYNNNIESDTIRGKLSRRQFSNFL